MISRCIGAAVVLTMFSTGAFAATASKQNPTLRDQEQAACYDDAMRLCKDAVPDEGKITACMKANMSQVSAGCRKFFN